jgi:hypothetical protein
MNIIPFLILVSLTLTILFVDHEQLKLFSYMLQPFTSIKPLPVPLKKRRIAIITAEDRDYPFIKYHDLNFKKYSEIHGYSYFRLDNCPKEVATTYWCKIHRVKDFLDSGEYDYVMWADSDTIIPDLSKSLDVFISNVGEPDIIIGRDTWGFFDLNSFCAGVFLIKNSNVGKSFINDCLIKIKSKNGCIIDNKEQGVWAGICYEQGLMNLFLREKYKDYTFVDIDMDYVLNTMDVYNSRYNINRPIILHLAGHKNNVREEFFKQYI